MQYTAYFLKVHHIQFVAKLKSIDSENVSSLCNSRSISRRRHGNVMSSSSQMAAAPNSVVITVSNSAGDQFLR